MFELGSFDDHSGLLGLKLESLEYNEGYGDLGGLGNVTIGYEPFVRAVSKGQGKVAMDELNVWKNQIMGCLATLAFMLCEGARFSLLFDKYARLMMTFGSNIRVESWMQIFINGWEAISDVALNGEMSGMDNRAPPTTVIMYMLMKTREWLLNIKIGPYMSSRSITSTRHSPNVSSVRYRNFHLVIVGDIATGMTSFMKTCHTREFLNNEEWGSYGLIAGMLKKRRSCAHFVTVAKMSFMIATSNDFAIILFDLTKKSTYDSVLKWNEDLRSDPYLEFRESRPDG
ncbi:GTP-binding nuclear protein Ran-3 [Tanacetum coccineum]